SILHYLSLSSRIHHGFCDSIGLDSQPGFPDLVQLRVLEIPAKWRIDEVVINSCIRNLLKLRATLSSDDMRRARLSKLGKSLYEAFTVIDISVSVGRLCDDRRHVECTAEVATNLRKMCGTVTIKPSFRGTDV